jgi:hypothetical protein
MSDSFHDLEAFSRVPLKDGTHNILKTHLRMKKLLFLLALNVVAVGIYLYRTDAGPLVWTNLFGCVVFGMALATRNA